MLKLEEWEDGLKFSHVIMDDEGAVLFKKDYWLGSNGNEVEFEPDKKFLTELVKVANESDFDGEQFSD